MTTACVPIQFNNPFFTGIDRGVSESAKDLRTYEMDLLQDCSQSVLIGTKDSLFELQEVLEECSRPNWDGYGASPVDFESFFEADRFIQALPTSIPEPEVSVDPDGEISLEWHKEPMWVFSISIGARSEITYAGLFGLNKMNGREYFGDEIPKTIIDNLDRLFS